MPQYEDYGELVKTARKSQGIYPHKLTHDRLIDRLSEKVMWGQSKPTKSALSKIEHGNNLPSANLAAGMAIVTGEPALMYQHPKTAKYVDAWLKIAQERVMEFDLWAAAIVLEALLQIDSGDIITMTLPQKTELYHLKALHTLYSPNGSHHNDIYTDEELAKLELDEAEAPSVIPIKLRLRRALMWLTKLEKAAEMEGITPSKRIEVYLYKADAYFWSHEEQMTVEYAMRAKTVAESLILDEQERRKEMKTILWWLCTAHGQLDDPRDFARHYKEYSEIVPREESPVNHARIMSVRGGHEMYLCHHKEAVEYFGDVMSLLVQSTKNGEPQDARASINTFMYIWSLHFAGLKEKAWALLESIERNDLQIYYEGEYCGSFIFPLNRVRIMLRILGGTPYSEVSEQLETWYKVRSEESVVVGSIDELIAIAYANQGEKELAIQYYKDAIELTNLVLNKTAVEGTIRRAERRTGESFLEERMTYVY